MNTNFEGHAKEVVDAMHEDIEYEFLIARGSKFLITDVVINEEPIPAQTIIKMRMIVDA